MVNIMGIDYFTTFISTPFGAMAVVWWDTSAGPRIRQTILCRKENPAAVAGSLFSGVREQTCREVNALGRRLGAFLEGEKVDFDLANIALETCGEFQRKVLMAEYRIPRGRISTYGRIAGHIKAPGAARAVGTALATNPFPIVIPCHRALRADGSIGGYQGGAKMKRALLEMEGVKFSNSGNVLLKQAVY
jgi:methylated-DNA-[protein]-cysteine S-methyltransferase